MPTDSADGRAVGTARLEVFIGGQRSTLDEPINFEDLTLLEQIRDQIERRLDEITAEADRVREALAHLGESRQPAARM